MGARSFRNMAFGNQADPGGSHAPTPSYLEPDSGPSVRHQASSELRPDARLQTQGHRPDPLGRLARRRHRPHLDPRLLPAAPRHRLRGDDSQGPHRLDARVRRTPAATQPRPGRSSASGPAATLATPGDRPDLDPLPRRALPPRERGLPRSGQAGHQPLPRLRHRLRHPQGATLHRRLDGGGQGRVDEGRLAAALEAVPGSGSRPGWCCWTAVSTGWR
jgi:hypothetical protein